MIGVYVRIQTDLVKCFIASGLEKLPLWSKHTSPAETQTSACKSLVISSLESDALRALRSDERRCSRLRVRESARSSSTRRDVQREQQSNRVDICRLRSAGASDGSEIDPTLDCLPDRRHTPVVRVHLRRVRKRCERASRNGGERRRTFASKQQRETVNAGVTDRENARRRKSRRKSDQCSRQRQRGALPQVFSESDCPRSSRSCRD